MKSKDKDELEKLVSKILGKLLADGDVRGGPKLVVANGVWFDESLSLKEKFAQVVKNVYKSDVEKVVFQTEYDEVTREINSWAKEKTMGLVKDFLPPGLVDQFTRLVFTNAIHFKGSWTEEFNPSDTKDHIFHLLSGAEVKVPFMTNKKRQFAEQFDGFKVLGLPYKNGNDNRKFSMYTFLPDSKDGLPALVEKLSSGTVFLDRHIPRNKVELRTFLIPKFKISYEFKASEVLKNLGLESIFKLPNGLTEIADYSSLGEELVVSEIIHKAVIEVNEKGTKAAAITACFCRTRPRPRSKIVDFVADHPFLFVIREDTTGMVLFVGQIVNPSSIS